MSNFLDQQKEVLELWKNTKKDLNQDLVEDLTFNNSIEFLKNLPEDLDAPDVGVLPNGQISFEWVTKKGDLTVIMYKDQVTYAQRLKSSSSTNHKGQIEEIIKILRELK